MERDNTARGSVPCLVPLADILDSWLLAMAGGARMLRSAVSMPSFPEWWAWELSFVGHAEMRMEQRGMTEVDVRVMLERRASDNRTARLAPRTSFPAGACGSRRRRWSSVGREGAA